MKLGHRLSSIVDMIPMQYQHIWDCCCDHGLLGAEMLNRQLAKQIHFVDIVPELMATVEQKLQRFYPIATDSYAYLPQWSVHTQDVAKLPLADYNGTQLIVIAGVGGDLMASMVNSLIQNNPQLTLDFLLCPVLQVATLRSTLIQHRCSLLDELLVTENKRFYELIYVRYQAEGLTVSKPLNNPLVSLFGDKIWQLPRNSHPASTLQATDLQRYLTVTINHYQKVAHNKGQQVDNLVAGYQHVLQQLS
ncbi:tRNA (adenine(22)-N(1))-methyltransferase [Shewanella gaetbuli]